MINREHSPFEQAMAQAPLQTLTLDTLGLEAFQVAQFQALASPGGAQMARVETDAESFVIKVDPLARLLTKLSA